MNCEWKNILVNSLKVNLQEEKITKRISSFKLPVSSIQQDGRPNVRILPFAGFIQFKRCQDGNLENQSRDNPKHIEIPFLTVSDMFLPAKDKLLNSLLLKVDTRSDILVNILKGSKFTEICWFLPYTKEEFRLCGSFHTIISSTITGKNYAPIGRPFCNTNSYNINWELLRKMVWDQMPEKEKKIYLDYNDKYCHSKINNSNNREYNENTYDYNYNANYQLSTSSSPGHSCRNSISRRKSNLSISRECSIKHNSSYKSNNVVIQNNNNEYQENQMEVNPYLLNKKETDVNDGNNESRKIYVKKYENEKRKDDYHYSSSSTKHNVYIEQTNLTKYNNNNINHDLDLNKKINYYSSSTHYYKTNFIRSPSLKSKSISLYEDINLSSLDRKPTTYDVGNYKETIINELEDKDTCNSNKGEKRIDDKKLLTIEDLEIAYKNFCLLIVDVDSIDYTEMSYFPRKKTTYYKIECPYFSIEDKQILQNKKENYFYRDNNKYDEKNLHKHYDNFNSIYPSMSTKQENIGYEPFTGNQIQNISYIFDNNEPMTKISKNQTIYKKVYWIKKKL